MYKTRPLNCTCLLYTSEQERAREIADSLNQLPQQQTDARRQLNEIERRLGTLTGNTPLNQAQNFALQSDSARLKALVDELELAQLSADVYKRQALGRDYHKLLRNRLKKLGEMIQQHCVSLNFRPFVDSAPILERPLAEKAGLGWTGKHSLILNREAGSFFFLGELLVDIPLPVDQPVEEGCGKCVACMTI